MHHEESSEGRKTNDRANFERFMNRWGASLTPDETTIANRYGYRIEWTESGGKYYRMEVNSSPQAKAPVDADQLLAEAQTLYTNGKFDEAAATLQNVVQNSVTLAGDNEFEAWQTLGNCFTRLNRAAEAEGAFSQAIKLNSDSERPYLGLGTLAMIEENWLAAQYSFMTALAKNPEATKGEFGVGLSLAARNRHEAALDRFARVLAKEPLNAEALFYYYRSSMEANKPAHPTDANFMFHLCGAYWKTGRVLNAIEMCEKVLKLDPTHSAANDILKHFEQTLAVNA
jgi:tetratricopeptide (TPR) repeat protein